MRQEANPPTKLFPERQSLMRCYADGVIVLPAHRLTQCFTGLTGCGEGGSCRLRHIWRGVVALLGGRPLGGRQSQDWRVTSHGQRQWGRACEKSARNLPP
jgi:hypothetical protein